MAFTRAEYPDLFDLMQTVDVDDWADKHLNGYIDPKIYLHRSARGRQPETFAQANASNWLPDLETDQKLVRVENLVAIQKLLNNGDDIEFVVKQFERFIENRTDSDAAASVEHFLRDYNTSRDQRPTFVGFWDEVKDLLKQDGDDWPNQLRDRLGLGHLDPGETGMIPILVLWYRVEEVRDDVDKNFAAIPTVLDGDFSQFFCPTPKDGWHQGQTVDLSPVEADETHLTPEILHRAMPYTPDHVYKVGWITKRPGRTCEEARRIHFIWLSDEFSHFGLLPERVA